MASLPPGRVGITRRCFASVSVDLAGPFETSQGRGKARTKRWIVLFTCLATRAVNLQLAYALDSDAYLRCWQRFKNQVGTPDEMYSDLGSNFTGARNELRRLHEHHQVTGIPWKLNPPASPHFGGVHESLVKSVKLALPPVLTNQTVTDEEFTTILSNVEVFLNARPLIVMSTDVQDLTPLTPSHFLIGRQNLPSPEEVRVEGKPPFRLRWSLVQDLSNHIWARFVSEYLPTLQTRAK